MQHGHSSRTLFFHTNALILSLIITSFPIQADLTLTDRLGALFDDVTDGLDLLGEKAEDLLGPGLGFGAADSAAFTELRELEERYPLAPAATVSISNEFGEIRVETWDNPVADIHATVTVRAESPDLARELCLAVDIRITPNQRFLEIRTILPDTRPQPHACAISVDYLVTIPKDTAVIAQNCFGDTFVAGVGGTLAIDARYGLVDIHDISAPVTVRTWGEFPLKVRALHQGGAFDLHDTQASFANVSGNLVVSNFRGSVEIADLPDEFSADISTQTALINVHLDSGPDPDITAIALFGSITSDLPLDRTSQGSFEKARHPNVDATRRLSLRASCGDIAIHRQPPPGALPPASAYGHQPFKQALTEKHDVSETGLLHVEAIAGDVHILGVDENQVVVTATKLIRVASPPNARAALQALDFRVDAGPDALTVRTSAMDDLAALGCTSYRVDLVIECPRTLAITVRAQDGHTDIRETGAPVTVNQATGAISVQHVKAQLTLANQKGDVRVSNCAGPVDVTSLYGTVTLSNVFANINATCTEGKTVIEAPHADLFVRASHADTRIMALEGVHGNFDIQVDDADLSILIPPSADATLTLTAHNGTVDSALPLSGTIQKGLQKFIGTLNNGRHQVSLNTTNGNIILD